MATFDELVQEFITKFFPPSKMEKLRSEVHQFKQQSDESFKDAWDRFQELLRRCPSRLVEEGYELQLFYNGLSAENKNIVNASAGGTITEKTYEDVKQLFNKIAKNNSIAPVERGREIARKQGAVLELDSTSDLAAQIALLTTQFNTFLKTQQGSSTISCGLCKEQHHTDQCPQLSDVNFVRNFQRNDAWQPQQNQQRWDQNQRGDRWQNPQRPPQWQQQPINQNYSAQQGYNVWQPAEQPQPWQAGGSNDNRRAPPGFNQGTPALTTPTVPLLEYKPPSEDSSFAELKKWLEENQRDQRRLYEEQRRTLEEQRRDMAFLKAHVKNLDTQLGQVAQEANRRPAGGLPSDTDHPERARSSVMQ